MDQYIDSSKISKKLSNVKMTWIFIPDLNPPELSQFHAFVFGRTDQETFAVYCDIIDEAGGIAAIATILASNNISIKNIGIVHNREFEEGFCVLNFTTKIPANAP